jgi:hypothetical protein
MTEHVIVTVTGQDAEVAGLWGIPLSIEVADLVLTTAKYKSKRALVCAMARIALDVNVHCPSGKNASNKQCSSPGLGRRVGY